MTALAKDERPQALYAMCLIAGVLLRVENGELIVDAPKVDKLLMRRIEANKAGLIEYIQRLPYDGEIYVPAPPERVLIWIKRKLADQEQAEKKIAPSIYHEWIATVERLIREPIRVDIGNANEFEKLDELAF